MSAWSARSTTTVSARRDIFGGAVPTVVLDFNRTDPDAPKLEMNVYEARAVARELNRAARALAPGSKAKP